ncbi:MAG TPA: hypothetical protein VER37_05555 [Thermomicrobiales bacterium]|nr:hypothetical protein [Thermomicrobiales bacterium]
MSDRSSSGTNASGNAASGSGAAPGTGTENLTEQGKEAAGQIQEQAGRLVDLARDQVSTRLVAQKDRAAGGADSLALVLQQVAQQFRQQDQGTVAQYVDSAAGQVEQLADTLREQDIDQLVTTVGRYARRQPAPFLAATFALGFLGTRFFKSSQPHQETGSQGLYGYPSSAAWADRFETGSSATGGYGSTGYGSTGYGSGGYASGTASSSVGGGLDYGSSSLPTSGAGLTGTDLTELEVTETDLSGTGMGGTGLTGSSATGMGGTGLTGSSATGSGADLTSSTNGDAGAEGR